MVWGRVFTCREDGNKKFVETLVVLYQTKTNSMEQSPSCETNKYLDSEEIPRLLWNSTVHYGNQKSLPPIYILTQNNQRPFEMSRNMVSFNG